MRKYFIGSLVTFIIMIGFIYIYNNYYNNQSSDCFESIEIYSTTDISLENLTLLSNYEYDYDNDNIDEEVLLYTSAQKDEYGIIMWADGQDFTLVVKDNEEYFILFDEYVQIGKVDLYVYTSDSEFHISTLQPGSASFIVTDYKYNKENNIFEKITFYNPNNVNMMYQSYYE